MVARGTDIGGRRRSQGQGAGLDQVGLVHTANCAVGALLLVERLLAQG
ncbi:hypothetical protein ACGH52_21440 [Streptomyces sp. BBFR25]